MTMTMTMTMTMGITITPIRMPIILWGLNRCEAVCRQSAARTAETPMQPYLKDPQAIYRKSFAIVREQAAISALPAGLAEVAVRLVHACGMPDILDDLDADQGFADKAVAALLRGAPIFCDCEMVASGITRRFLPAGNDVIVTLNDPRTPDLAISAGTTRSAAAVDLWGDRLAGALVVVGNAPTALFRVLEIMAAGGVAPAAIIGCPVGFVGAAESKQALAEFGHDRASWLAVHGTRGGSAMASAVVNALCLLAANSIADHPEGSVV
jgi:precorrin-8X/cobalt-precorrin-8 methylmutase